MRKYLWLSMLLGVTFWVYYLGLFGTFFFDDIINIVDNPHIKIDELSFESLSRAAYSGEAGLLGRPISVVSFAMNYHLDGLDPFGFKLTNLFVHLFNGFCVFILSRMLLNHHERSRKAPASPGAIDWISLAVAAAWLLHPLNMSSVLFVVQRMTSLSACFSLLGMIAYCYGRTHLEKPLTALLSILATFVLFLPLSIFSKENGALLPAYLLLIEVIFFSFRGSSPKIKWLLIIIFAVFLVFPLFLVISFAIKNPGWIVDGYSIRDFSLVERLMTEARIVWFYIRLTFLPDILQMGMYHDDIRISKGLLEPASTMFSIFGILAISIAGFLSTKRLPIFAFGVLFYIAGHSMESSVFALELVHEHRNYLPMLGILLPAFYYGLYPLYFPQKLAVRRAVSVGLIALFAVVTLLRAIQWGDPVEMKLKEVQHHPDSIRANIAAGAFFASIPATSAEEGEVLYQKAYSYYVKAAELGSTDTLGLFGLIELNSRYHLPIEESWLQALAGRIESSPFAASTGNSIVSLEKCFFSKQCRFPASALEDILNAALRNKTLQGPAKIQVKFAQSDFVFREKNDFEAATKLAFEAANADLKSLDNQITLINMLINMGKYYEAHERITLVRDLDKYDNYVSILAQREKMVEEFLAANKDGEGRKR